MFSLRNRKLYPIYFLLTLAVMIIPVRFMVPLEARINFLVPVVAAAAGFAYFLYTQNLNETKLFADLFKQFNDRYEKLNGPLASLKSGPEDQDLSGDQLRTLVDYFNLCAEEFLYYEAGFIDQHVWSAWKNGMKIFASDVRIGKYWEKELASGSYYGFSLDLLKK
jgi:hypothetical protein